MISFHPIDDGLVEASFDDDELDLLTTLTRQVSGLLAPLGDSRPSDPLPGLVVGGSTALPDDAALTRLLPNAYGDPDQASEFRQLTERGLAGRKLANAEVLLETAGASTRLDAAQALAWMRALTDIRLVIAARLGIESDDSVVEESDEAEAMLAVYDWLAGVQDSLVRAVDR